MDHAARQTFAAWCLRLMLMCCYHIFCSGHPWPFRFAPVPCPGHSTGALAEGHDQSSRVLLFTESNTSPARRVEYIRLLEQALSQLGFEGAAAQLQRESGVALEAPEIGRLRAAVLAGDFTEAVQLLGQLPLSDYEYRRAEFALLEQNFLEVCLYNPLESRK